MCRTDYDEVWTEFDAWWGTGRCIDCGFVGRVRYEELGPETAPIAHVIDVLLSDCVLDWSEEWEREVEDIADDARYVYLSWPTPNENCDTQPICENCIEARRWLMTWCRTYVYGDYLGDIVEHWEEAEIERTITFGRLALAAKRRWAPRGRRLTVEEVRRLVDRSLDRLRRDTGLSHSDAA